MKRKKVNNIFKKILVAMAFIFGIFGIAMLANSAYAKEKTNDLPQGVDDPGIYNDCEWSKANVEYWVQHSKQFLWWGDQTKSFIRITNEDGEMVDTITRIEAEYELNDWGHNRVYKYVNRNLYAYDGSLFGFFNGQLWEAWGQANSEEGHFSKITEALQNEGRSAGLVNDSGADYKDCNYVWHWNHNVEKILYLYIWYLDVDGTEKAASFLPNGEHPIFNEDGEFEAIVDVNGNILEGYTLSEYGIPQDEMGSDLVTVEDQLQGELRSANANFNMNVFSMLGVNSGASLNTFQTIITIIGLILALVLIALAIKYVTKFVKFLKK